MILGYPRYSFDFLNFRTHPRTNMALKRGVGKAWNWL